MTRNIESLRKKDNDSNIDDVTYVITSDTIIADVAYVVLNANFWSKMIRGWDQEKKNDLDRKIFQIYSTVS